MGLFDGIFSDSKPQTSTPVTPTEPMPQGTTVTPAAIDELLNISAGNVTPDMPSYTAQKASQTENSPVIISETPTVAESASPVIISDTPATSPVIMETQTPVSPIISEVTPTVQANSPVIMEAPMVEMNSPIITEEASLSEVQAPVIAETPIISEAPVASPVISEVPMVDSTVNLVSEAPVDSLFATPAVSSENNILSLSEEKNEVTPSVTSNEVSENSLFATEAPTPSIFGFEADSQASSENIFTETPVATSEISMPENTEGFIAASLLQLEKMEKALAERKQKFLDQAEEYRSEKEKFAQLEEEAIENSRSMDDEQKKIDTMKKYFNKQLQGPNINDSVDTALTGIAVQNAVGNTIEKKTTRKKTTSLV